MVKVSPRGVISHLMLCVVGVVFWPYFFVLNRTKVHGRRDLRITPNTLLVSNHQSSIDSVLIGITGLFPLCAIRPRLMPWNLAAAGHFFSTPARARASRLLRCIPVRSGGGDVAALRDLDSVLRTGVVIYFPEGSRSRDGRIREFRRGVGLLALSSQARVIPVAIDGMGSAVRFDRFGLRFFRRIQISFGKTVDLSRFADCAIDRDSAQEAANIILECVREQHRLLGED
jgi:1-acyl-sn-glycerol-3-phosphate acyltransferase